MDTDFRIMNARYKRLCKIEIEKNISQPFILLPRIMDCIWKGKKFAKLQILHLQNYMIRLIAQSIAKCTTTIM